MKGKNPWVAYLDGFRKKHPKMSLTEAMRAAKKSYNKKWKERESKLPLTKKGKKLRNIFQMEYGKNRGTNIFYAYERRHPWLKLTRTRKR